MGVEAVLVPGVNKLADGVVARVTLERPHENVIPTNTSWHEAGHGLPMIVRGRNLRRMSRVPNLEKGYLGVTEGEVDAVAAMTPRGLGFDGTGWDREVARRLGDTGSAKDVGVNIINSNWRAYHVLARTIEAEEEVSGHRAKEVIEQDRNPKAKVELEGPFGTRSFVAATREANGYAISFNLSESLEDRMN